jgi:1-deoxy-D-xylulose-5-phosphate reductoisomerase
VELVDGSVLAQLGVPSMELPILYALTHPERLTDLGVPRYDPAAASPLTFEPVRLDAFPALGLGLGAGRAGGAAPAVFNAANEQAVALFLDGRIGFGDIARAICLALDALGSAESGSRDAILQADGAARRLVQERFAC